MTRRALCLLPFPAIAFSAASLTARQVVERIQSNLGVPWRTPTVDTIKTANENQVVKGIATSMFPSLDVMQRATAEGKNMIIVHEPTFYNHQDSTADLKGEVLSYKQEYIAKHGIVVFRFHDNWHARRPDGIFTGMTRALDWNRYQGTGNRFELPTTTLRSLAASIAKQLRIRTVRVLGEPEQRASKIALIAGFASLQGVMRAVDDPNVDVIVVGESREWEGVEYVRDAITAGKKKGLIVLGHVPSEEAGMEECARWLKTFISEIPIGYVPAGEPFWPVR